MTESEEDELEEESLLETPLDKVEPYMLFRDALLSTVAIRLPSHRISN